jgi:glycine oxidase
MLGPAMAEALFDHIENNTLLDKEIDVKRFADKRKKK